MPLYPYRCPACEHEEDHFQKMKDAHLAACPACGAGGYQRLIGLPNGRVRQCQSAAEMGLRIPTDKEVAQKKSEKEKKTPWWRNGTVEGLPKKAKPIDVTKCDVNHYVATGEEKSK
jgi:putative FmdB family regulatory protein